MLDYPHNPKEFNAVIAVIAQLECPGRHIVAFIWTYLSIDQLFLEIGADIV